MKLILIGAPASGKGTIAKKISNDFNIPQISTGDMFRACVSEGNELGKQLKSYMDEGKLVPDVVTVKLLKERISQVDCNKGFILDGFPRNVAQAEALKGITQIDSVILIDAPYDVIEKRIVTRRICPACGEIDSTLHEEYSGKCRKCQTPLYHRDDDTLETVRNRLEVYEKNTSPLINFYSELLHKFVTQDNPEHSYAPVKTFLKSLED